MTHDMFPRDMLRPRQLIVKQYSSNTKLRSRTCLSYRLKNFRIFIRFLSHGPGLASDILSWIFLKKIEHVIWNSDLPHVV